MLTLLFACAAPPDSVDAPKPGDTGDTAADTDTDTDTDSDSDTDSDTDTDTDSDTDSESDTDTDSDSDTDTDPASALRISSDTPSSDFGRIVRVGDVTGDGVDDLVSGTFLRDGKTGGGIVVPGPITADGVAEELGFVLTGAERGAGTGRSVSVGDLDGDGVADVGLGAPYSDLDDGMYVTFGPVTGDRALADGALLRAPRSTYGGHGSDLSGDVNGDGQVDAVVGAYWTTSTNGSVFVAFGPVTGDLDLETEADAVLTGEAPDTYAGRTVAAGEDLDGDGIGDLVIACLGTMGPPASGGLYVAYGPPAGAMDLADADGRYVGATANAAAGLWLAAGDLSGDGLADLVASAYNDELAKTGGAAYVVYGPASANADLGIADVIVRGDIAGQYGGGVETADFDGDGVHELLLGAQGDPSAGTNGGAAFVFWDPAPGEYNFTDADFAFYAEAAGDNLGVGINAGDVDGDGAMDLLFGAPYEDSGGTDAGSVYVVDP